MKKMFKSYLAIWAVLLVLFNVIAFVSVGWTGQEKYTSSFWIGYVSITIAFLGQLACTNYALKNDAPDRSFFSLSHLFATTTNGRPAAKKYSAIVTSSAVGAWRESTIRTPMVKRFGS